MVAKNDMGKICSVKNTRGRKKVQILLQVKLTIFKSILFTNHGVTYTHFHANTQNKQSLVIFHSLNCKMSKGFSNSPPPIPNKNRNEKGGKFEWQNKKKFRPLKQTIRIKTQVGLNHLMKGARFMAIKNMGRKVAPNNLDEK